MHLALPFPLHPARSRSLRAQVHEAVRSALHTARLIAFLLPLLWPSPGRCSDEQATDYRLGPGDALRILVYQNPDLSMEQRVQDDGRLTYPLLGALPVGGLTVRQAERLIEGGLREGGYLRQPQVAVVVAQVRAHQVSVLGQVQRPGRFAVESPPMKLSDLLAQAGGLTPVGSERVILMGQRQGRPWRQEIDLPALFSADSPQPDLMVVGGDVVFVDRAPIVYVVGEVQRPGAVRLERGMTVLQALAAGGGTTPRGTTRGLRLTRQGPAGPLAATSAALHDTLQPGDVLQVPESLF